MNKKTERKTGDPLLADTEPGSSGSTAAHTGTVDRQAAQAGAMLRQMRQSAGVDPMLLASALKVTLQKVQALEEGRLDDLPGLPFARGLAAAVCRYFAADPEPVLALMPRVMSSLSARVGAPRESFKPSAFHAGDGDRGGPPRQHASMPSWLLAVVAVLLIGALAIWLIPGQHAQTSGPKAASTASADEASGPVTEPASASESETASTAEAAASQAAATVPPASVETASAVGASAPESAASAPASNQQGNVEQDVVTFNAASSVWVGVHDGSGKPILNRTLAAGDTLSVSGKLPLTVTVGDKTAVTVMVRGQTLDLSGYTLRGLVARFTVGPANGP